MYHKRTLILAAIVLIFLPVFAYAGTVQLPETGQTKCYRGVSPYDEISCTGTGQDGEIRAGVSWPDPRFTQGTGIESDCIVDNLTGLMWTRNGNRDGGYMNWYSAIDNANDSTLCGYSDWRLPNVTELESLVNADVPNTATWLNTQGFYNVQSYYYWSSTTIAYSTSYAWIVSMWYGGVDYGGKDEGYGLGYVWPVRSGIRAVEQESNRAAGRTKRQNSSAVVQ